MYGMAFVAIELDIDGDKRVVRYLFGVEERVKHARPAFTKIGHDMRRYERELFDTQGASGGKHWAPDTPETRREKARLRTVSGASRRKRLDPRVNHATRRLRKSLTTGGADSILKSTNASVTLGTRVPYAKYAQHGTRHAPARPVIVFSKPQQTEMRRTLKRWIMYGVL